MESFWCQGKINKEDINGNWKKKRIFARVTYLPNINDNPQSSSTDFARGIK